MKNTLQEKQVELNSVILDNESLLSDLETRCRNLESQLQTQMEECETLKESVGKLEFAQDQKQDLIINLHAELDQCQKEVVSKNEEKICASERIAELEACRVEDKDTISRLSTQLQESELKLRDTQHMYDEKIQDLCQQNETALEILREHGDSELTALKDKLVQQEDQFLSQKKSHETEIRELLLCKHLLDCRKLLR